MGAVAQPHSHLWDQHKEMLRMLLSSKPLGYELCYGWIQESLASPTFRNKTEFPTLCSDPKHYESGAKHLTAAQVCDRAAQQHTAAR